MNVEVLREYALSKKHATEDMPFGPDVLCFRVGGKIFGLLPLDTDPPRINLKCDPDRVIELREEFNCVLPGYHMNKAHWNTVLLAEDATWDLVKDLTDHSYDLILNSLPKKTLKELNIDA